MLHNNGTTIMVLFNVFLFYFFPSFDRTQKFIFKEKTRDKYRKVDKKSTQISNSKDHKKIYLIECRTNYL